jgi:hypothetical protein
MPQNVGIGTDDHLASWNDGATKRSILDFVARVTKEGGTDYVAPRERITTFDNDGTLWSERPYPFQIAFALDRVNAMMPQHSEWRDKDPFKSVIEGDVKGMLSGSYHALLEKCRGHPFRHDDGQIRDGGPQVGGYNAPSEDQQAVHRNGVPTDAGTAHLPPGQRLQDLHCLRRGR